MSEDKKKVIVISFGCILIVSTIIFYLMSTKNTSDTPPSENNNNNGNNNTNNDIVGSGNAIYCEDDVNKYINYTYIFNDSKNVLSRVIYNTSVNIGIYSRKDDSIYLTEEDKANIENDIYHEMGIERDSFSGVNVIVTYPSDRTYDLIVTTDINYDIASKDVLKKLGMDYKASDKLPEKILKALNGSNFNCRYINK